MYSRREDRDSDSDNLSSTMGLVQALVSVFIDDNDKLRSINAGELRITFLLRSPLYYVCASTWGEPESVVSATSSDLRGVATHPTYKIRTHLEYLHLQILSIVTAAQLRRIFERHTNFDLRRLLNGKISMDGAFGVIIRISTCCPGAEPFLFSLLGRLESDLAMTMSSLHCLQLDPSLRTRVADALVPITKMKAGKE